MSVTRPMSKSERNTLPIRIVHAPLVHLDSALEHVGYRER
jgi:hypothetical protein